MVRAKKITPRSNTDGRNHDRRKGFVFIRVDSWLKCTRDPESF